VRKNVPDGCIGTGVFLTGFSKDTRQARGVIKPARNARSEGETPVRKEGQLL